MEKDFIKGGCFMVARKIFTSEIWLKKPASWKIIWIYILGKVNHQKNKDFDRGEGFFNFAEEKRAIGIDIKYDTIMRFLSSSLAREMIRKTKSTRGIVIKVLNYNIYQEIITFKRKTERKTERKTNARQTQDYKQECKECKECKELYIVRFEEIWKRYPRKRGGKPLAKDRFTASVKSEQDWKDINKALDNYLLDIENNKTEEQYIKTGATWFGRKHWKGWISVEDKKEEKWKYHI